MTGVAKCLATQELLRLQWVQRRFYNTIVPKALQTSGRRWTLAVQYKTFEEVRGAMRQWFFELSDQHIDKSRCSNSLIAAYNRRFRQLTDTFWSKNAKLVNRQSKRRNLFVKRDYKVVVKATDRGAPCYDFICMHGAPNFYYQCFFFDNAFQPREPVNVRVAKQWQEDGMELPLARADQFGGCAIKELEFATSVFRIDSRACAYWFPGYENWYEKTQPMDDGTRPYRMLRTASIVIPNDCERSRVDTRASLRSSKLVELD